jgi:cytochrome c-type biogenesis protein
VVSLSAGFLVLAAFLAGLVSFSSPCCLPLLPGYVAYVSGEAVSRPQHVRRTMTAAGLFTLGFGVTFTALGASASWLGAVLLAGRPGLIRAAGVLVAAVGALTVAGAEPRVLARERRLLRLDRVPRGPVFAAPLGAAFALGWTPCIGPVLAGLLAAAAASPTMLAGASLLGVYSAGLAVPFLFSAVAFNAATRSFGFFKRHYAGIQLASGAVLVAMGVLVLSGELFRLNIEVQQFLDRFDLNFFQDV